MLKRSSVVVVVIVITLLFAIDANAQQPSLMPGPTPPPDRPTSNILRVRPSLRAVRVDGEYRRVEDGVVVVPCGHHRINEGMQYIEVPCDGSGDEAHFSDASAFGAEPMPNVVPLTSTPKSESALRLGVFVAPGVSARRLAAVSFVGADLAAGFSIQPRTYLALGADLHGFGGRSPSGLELGSLTFEGTLAVVIASRFHFGVGLGIFGVGMNRASANETILGWGLGGLAFARAEVIRLESVVFSIGLSADIGRINVISYGGYGAGIRVDFDVSPTSSRAHERSMSARRE